MKRFSFYIYLIFVSSPQPPYYAPLIILIFNFYPTTPFSCHKPYLSFHTHYSHHPYLLPYSLYFILLLLHHLFYTSLLVYNFSTRATVWHPFFKLYLLSWRLVVIISSPLTLLKTLFPFQLIHSPSLLTLHYSFNPYFKCGTVFTFHTQPCFRSYPLFVPPSALPLNSVPVFSELSPKLRFF